MKRSIFLAISLGVALLGVTAIALAQTPSVPNLINFQGRLTDNIGNPVVNGAHTVNFYIFPVRTGGLDVWNEATTQTTTGGLFTTQLGLVNPLPLTLFEDYDSLFLEIVADAQTISPRTLLTATPSTRVANALESSIGSAVYSKSYNYPGLGGALHLYDELGNWTVRAEPDFGGLGGFFNVHARAGGANGVYMYGDAGTDNSFVAMTGVTNTAYFDMSQIGDASVQLPTDAVNSGEILDEPGVSNNDVSGFPFFLFGSGNIDYKVDSVDITVPAAGYIEVTSSGYVNMFHTNGTRTEVWVTVDPTSPPPWIPVGSAVIGVPAGEVTDLHQIPYTTSRLFAVGVPGTYRYYLLALYVSGTNASTDLAYYFTRATYYPTLYGTVTLAKAGGTGTTAKPSPGGLRPLQKGEMTTITVADHNARLETERAKQMAELEARIKRLEGQAAGQLPGQGTGIPRKER